MGDTAPSPALLRQPADSRWRIGESGAGPAGAFVGEDHPRHVRPHVAGQSKTGRDGLWSWLSPPVSPACHRVRSRAWSSRLTWAFGLRPALRTVIEWYIRAQFADLGKRSKLGSDQGFCCFKRARKFKPISGGFLPSCVTAVSRTRRTALKRGPGGADKDLVNHPTPAGNTPTGTGTATPSSSAVSSSSSVRSSWRPPPTSTR